MVQTLEAIRGGGGSIKVGSTGTISSLMSRELDSAKQESNSIDSVLTSDNLPTAPKPKTSNEASSSSSTNIIKTHKNPETPKKSKLHSGSRSTHHIPMLKSGDTSIDATPIRQKRVKKMPNMVEIVDIKCGNTDKAWVNPITTRLKKLGFSKLSENAV